MSKNSFSQIGFLALATMSFCSLQSLGDNTESAAISECDTSFLDTEPKLSWGGDPFLKKPGYFIKEDNPDEWKLEAVLWDTKSPKAIVNGHSYSVGDSLDKGKIFRIGENYVLVEERDSIRELLIKPVSSLPSLIQIDEVKP